MLLSVDPGKSGAYVLWTDDGDIADIVKVKVPPKQRFFDIVQLSELDSLLSCCHTCVIESFLDMKAKGQSPAATNTTACNHGMQQATAILNNCDLVLMHPRVWKRRMNLIKKEKEESVTRAQEYVTDDVLMTGQMRKPNIDIAEAILIGLAYGIEGMGWQQYQLPSK